MRSWVSGGEGGVAQATCNHFQITFDLSPAAKRLSGNHPPYQGTPCSWTWEELERREVAPPFKPKLVRVREREREAERGRGEGGEGRLLLLRTTWLSV